MIRAIGWWAGVVVLAASPAMAAQDLAPVAPVMECAALAAQEFSTSEAPVTMGSAAEAEVNGRKVCVVEGTISPRITFRVQMPVTGWTQRYLQTGCGGLCGRLGIESPQRDCPALENGEFAMASTDMGHDGSGGRWGASDMQLRVDFGYRGVHQTAVIAKRIIAAYYGQEARFSYFSGCSDGGREALMEAQRYPQDFDGIAAGAAALNFLVQNSMFHGWNAHVVQPQSDQPRLTEADLKVLHTGVMAACDALDGMEDGLIADPMACRFDPMTLVGEGEDHLTPTAAMAAAELYRGAHDGETKLVVGSLLPGSELEWAGVAVAGPPPGGRGGPQPGDAEGAPSMDQVAMGPPPGAGGGFALSPMVASEMIQSLAYVTPFDPDWRLSDFAFTRDSLEAMRPMHAIFDATNPDIGAFADRGGRLIVWHGLADPHISALNSVAWVQAVGDTLGAERAGDTLRLFLIPGMAHCGGGAGLTSIDVMTPLMDWVEDGRAPEALVASADDAAAGRGEGRTIFAFPATSVLAAGGDADDPQAWSAGPPMAVGPAIYKDWAGADFFTPGFQKDCGFGGLEFVCTPAAP